MEELFKKSSYTEHNLRVSTRFHTRSNNKLIYVGVEQNIAITNKTTKAQTLLCL
jgi:hypothetical protein